MNEIKYSEYTNIDRGKIYMRYIKYYDIDNQVAEYINENLQLFLHALCIQREYLNNNAYEYKKVREEIYRYIRHQYPSFKISLKQIRRLIRPRKNRVSKYAPVILKSIMEMLLNDNIPKILHENICIRNAQYELYSNFALNKLLWIVYNAPASMEKLFFFEHMGNLNNNYPDGMGTWLK